MKYQKRYKPKTKFEKFLKVYFIVPLSVSECFLKIFSTEKRVVLINISYFLQKKIFDSYYFYGKEEAMKPPRPCGAQLLWTWYPNRSIAPEIPYPKGVTDVCKVLTDVPLSSFERRGQMSPRWLYE